MYHIQAHLQAAEAAEAAEAAAAKVAEAAAAGWLDLGGASTQAAAHVVANGCEQRLFTVG